MVKYGSSQMLTVSAASARSTILAVGTTYHLATSTAIWFRQGNASVAASAGDGSHLLMPGQIHEFTVRVAADDGYMAVLQHATGGNATISVVDGV